MKKSTKKPWRAGRRRRGNETGTPQDAAADGHEYLISAVNNLVFPRVVLAYFRPAMRLPIKHSVHPPRPSGGPLIVPSIV